jgi:ferredoxin
VISDLLLGPEVPGRNLDSEYAEVEEFEGRTREERWSYFLKEMEKCMRCNACRNSCPSCYCRSCFAEQTMPQWVGIGQAPTDVETFQMGRLFHMAGRCVDCGTCSIVCPMGVDLRKFLKKIEKDGLDLFGHHVGILIDEPAPLATYKEDDPEDFIYNP